MYEREEGIKTYWLPLFFGDLYHSITFFDSQSTGVIDWIKIEAGQKNNTTQALVDLWQFLSPEQLMQIYGPPSQIHLMSSSEYSEPPEPERMDYSITFYYDKQGFFIAYGGTVEYKPVYHFCPIFTETGNLGNSIHLYLQSPDSKLTLKMFFEQMEGIPLFPYPGNYTLKNITGITIEEIYSLYLSDPASVCFDTPRDIWP